MLAQPDKIPVVFGDAVTCSSSVHFGTLAQARLLTPEALGYVPATIYRKLREHGHRRPGGG